MAILCRKWLCLIIWLRYLSLDNTWRSSQETTFIFSLSISVVSSKDTRYRSRLSTVAFLGSNFTSNALVIVCLLSLPYKYISSWYIECWKLGGKIIRFIDVDIFIGFTVLFFFIHLIFIFCWYSFFLLYFCSEYDYLHFGQHIFKSFISILNFTSVWRVIIWLMYLRKPINTSQCVENLFYLTHALCFLSVGIMLAYSL